MHGYLSTDGEPNEVIKKIGKFIDEEYILKLRKNPNIFNINKNYKSKYNDNYIDIDNDMER